MFRSIYKGIAVLIASLIITVCAGPKSLASSDTSPSYEWLSEHAWSYAAEAWAYDHMQKEEAAKGKKQEVSVASAPIVPEYEPEPIRILSYQVNSGDTLYQIARTFGVSVNELAAANPTVQPNRLQIGQLLDIPQAGDVWSGGNENRPVIQRVLSSTLTAYTAGKESTGKTPSHPAYGITRSGSKAEEGRTVAVDPSIIPLGSTVLIEGVGIRKAEDTGSAIRGSRIDVFMEDLSQAIDFGVKKNVKVYVLSDGSV